MTGDDLALRARLRALYEDYIVCLDELALERWPDFFTDEAVYKVTDVVVDPSAYHAQIISLRG